MYSINKHIDGLLKMPRMYASSPEALEEIYFALNAARGTIKEYKLYCSIEQHIRNIPCNLSLSSKIKNFEEMADTLRTIEDEILFDRELSKRISLSIVLFLSFILFLYIFLTK